MDKDLVELLIGFSVLVSLFILIGLFAQFLQRKLSRWEELSAVFPSPDFIREVEFHKHCPGRAGRFSFSGRRSGGFMVGFTPKGMIIRVKSRKYRDLFVPWYKIRSAAKYTLGSRSAVKVTIDSKIPLHFYISDEALSAFETWHKVKPEPLDKLVDDRGYY